LHKNTWLCTFCNKPGNIGTLDVLFGPYKIHVQNKTRETNIEKTIINDNKSSTKDNKENTSKNDTFLMDVWLHRDCAIWTSTICLSNQTLNGMADSLEAAGKTKCCSCNQYGATLECGLKQCRDCYHFVCAKQRGCTFKMENFTITCPKHKLKPVT